MSNSAVQSTMRQGVDCPGCFTELVWVRFRNGDPLDASYYRCYTETCHNGEMRLDTDGKLTSIGRMR